MRARDALTTEELDTATTYLRERGFKILDRNWSSPDGTIAIVAVDQKTLVAVELVTRTGNRYRVPLERAAARVRFRLRRAAVRWMADHGARYDTIRVDIIGLIAEGVGGFTIEHIRAVG